MGQKSLLNLHRKFKSSDCCNKLQIFKSVQTTIKRTEGVFMLYCECEYVLLLSEPVLFVVRLLIVTYWFKLHATTQ